MAAEVVGSVLVVAATAVTAFFTRRTSREANAVAGFRDLMTAQQTALDDVKQDLAAERGRTDKLEQALDDRRRLARAHERWDWRLMRKVEELSGESFPDPPPLDVYPGMPEGGPRGNG